MPSWGQQIVSSVVSLLVGWFLHVLKVTKDDKKTRLERKTKLLAFVNVWADDVAFQMNLIHATMPGAIIISGITSQLHSNRQQLIGRATELEMNYRGERLLHFRTLVNGVTLLKADTNKKSGQKELLSALRSLSEFVRQN
jgi:hypothetical protein